MDNPFELIVAIVNAGFSQAVMDAARKVGATGGTVLRGHGTANPEAESFFGIHIEPEKEIVLIVSKSATKDLILRGIYQECGLATAGQGIAFTLPIEHTAGLTGSKPNEA